MSPQTNSTVHMPALSSTISTVSVPSHPIGSISTTEQLTPPQLCSGRGCSLPDRDALFAEFTPLVQRLIHQYGQDPKLRQQLPNEIYSRFCALLQAYDPQRGVPLRPYLVRQLTAAICTYAHHQCKLKQREWAGEEKPLPNREALSQALAQLSALQRKVVIWHYYESRSFEEIARLLQIQVVMARSLLRHALNNLRYQFRAFNAEAG